MKRETKQSLLVAGIVLLAVLIDQTIKVYIKTHFQLGEAVRVTDWFYLCFVENDGMAFGIEWFSKLLLTLFRIVAIAGIGWYCHCLIYGRYLSGKPMAREGQTVRVGFLSAIAFTMAGALGNIIDCVFYGRLWGYAGWMYGKVVDMLYFPLIRNSAGECLFFRPVFNFADACITTAVIVILIWYRKDLNDSLEKPKAE